MIYQKVKQFKPLPSKVADVVSHQFILCELTKNELMSRNVKCVCVCLWFYVLCRQQEMHLPCSYHAGRGKRKGSLNSSLAPEKDTKQFTLF